MKVNIGPYVSWTGPFQIAETLRIFGVSKDRCYSIGEWLAENTPLSSICEWIHSKRKRNIKVKIDRYDSWGADSTLAIIIVPLLKQLHATKHGAPMTDDEDVPAELKLRSTDAPAKEQEWDVDGNHFKRFDWIMEEMIWAFTQLHPDTDWEDQYHTGVMDIKFNDLENGFSEMVKGPQDTHNFDKEGYSAHSARIDNGLRLFGKYYRGLWD